MSDPLPAAGSAAWGEALSAARMEAMNTARRTAAIASIAAAALLGVRAARADLTLVDQSRSVTTNAVTHAVNNVDTPTTASDPHTFTSTVSGQYAQTVTSSANQTVTGDMATAATQTYTYDAGATASQASSLSATEVDAAASVSASTYQTGLAGNSGANGSSGFAADFTVSVPTTIMLQGNLAGTVTYHEGPLEQVTDAVSLTGSTSGTLFTRTDQATYVQTTGPQPFNDSFAFTATLMPGQVYTLDASTLADSERQAIVGETSNVDGEGRFNLSLTSSTLPEPASVGLLGAAMAGLLGRRRSAVRRR